MKSSPDLFYTKVCEGKKKDMEILQELEQENVWQQYLENVLHENPVEWKKLQEYIAQKKYVPIVNNMKQVGKSGEEFTFIPRKVLLSKKGTDRKRVVYVYPYDVQVVLKVIAWKLHKYDNCFANNLFSFRKFVNAQTAVRYLREKQKEGDWYTYKLDIHNYFNSVSVDKILPMVKEVLVEEPILYNVICAILKNPYVEYNKQVIREEKGIMAGMPLSAFLANLYLTKIDVWFQENDILYARYSDDIIIFAQEEKKIEQYSERLTEMIHEAGLVLNEKKTRKTNPKEAWTFLGFQCSGNCIDVSDEALDKIKKKLKRKARALYRWKCKKKTTDEQAVRGYIRRVNKKFYEDNGENELTWSRWYFPVINTERSLRIIDHYVQECIRYVVTGQYNKKNYHFKYEKMKQCGYRSLVNEFYKMKGVKQLSETVNEK